MSFKKSEIMIITGEASGDLQAASLVKCIKEIQPEVKIYGIGGDKLRSMGANILLDSSSWGAIGLFDALKRVPGLYLALNKTKRYIRKYKPDMVILIDSPAFNMRIAQFTKSLNIPTVYYFPPSAWNCNPQKARKVSGLVTKVVAPFASIADVYRKAGLEIFYAGHPLVDIVKTSSSPEELYNKWGLDPQKLVIALLPGSREQEIKYILPIMLQTATEIYQELGNVQFILPIAFNSLKEKIHPKLASLKIPLVTTLGDTYNVMSVSDIILVTSGSATLEAMLLNKPMIIVYRLSWLSWLVARLMVKVPYIGLPNLITGKKIVPEFIQRQANPQNLKKALLEILHKKNLRQKMEEELRKASSNLGKPGVIKKIACYILDMETEHEEDSL